MDLRYMSVLQIIYIKITEISWFLAGSEKFQTFFCAEKSKIYFFKCFFLYCRDLILITIVKQDVTVYDELED